MTGRWVSNPCKSIKRPLGPVQTCSAKKEMRSFLAAFRREMASGLYFSASGL